MFVDFPLSILVLSLIPFVSFSTFFLDDESGEKSVSVLLAGEESELTFIDFATADMSVSKVTFLLNDHQKRKRE